MNNYDISENNVAFGFFCSFVCATHATHPLNTTATHIIKFSSVGIILVALAIAIVLGQLPVAIGLILLPFLLVYLFFLFKYPVIGVYTCLFFGFAANGIARYTPAPVGLTIDLFLTLTLLAAFFQRFETKQWPELNNPIVWLIGLWTIYCVVELFNPEAQSQEAWFYAVRSPAFYWLFAVLLGLMYFKTPRALQQFVYVWLAFSVVAALYGIGQFYFGLNDAENQWLAANASTHLLYGNLRVFSFYSDAAQFGSAMAHAGLAAIILLLGKQVSLKKRLLLILCAIVCLYGMILTGTRGALFILLVGFFAYLLLSRNLLTLAAGLVLLIGLVGILKFTYLGQSNFQVQRLRSALNPDDPSFQVRLKNQQKLSEYLETRPFGGGIGSAGYWGLRFSPDTLLAKTPTDSWYVKIWAETGIVGLVLYLSVSLFILIYLAVHLWRLHSPHKPFLLALFAGLAGIFVANYGNQVQGQMPTSLICYFSVAIIYNFVRQPVATKPVTVEIARS